ncbi:MAG: butyryl-CoA:acetate CoA-transferase [Syntrophomonadaceae bacterium]|jgi:acyl-CoA hydrolase
MKDYTPEYKSKLISADKAAQLIKDNDVIEYGMFSTKPIDFDIALAQRTGELKNVAVRGGPVVYPIPEIIIQDPEQKSFQYFSWIYSLLDRQLAESGGLSCYNPLNYHEGTMMGYNRLDKKYNYPSRPMANIMVTQTTPMDKFGCFNFGLSNCMTRAWASTADIVIVEVNENMPRCLGGHDECFHINEVDYIIEGSNSEIFAYPPYSPPIPEDYPVEHKIARLIADEIPDGACIQLGIGAVPNLIGELLVDSDIKNLGIHTEMFCDSMVRMHEAGKISNIYKAKDRNKSTYSFCIGKQETYDWLNDDPLCASCSIEYINNPQLIAANDNVVSTTISWQ